MNENSWLPPFYFKWLLVIALALHFFLPLGRLIPFPFSLIGLFLIGMAIYIVVAADRAFTAAKTTIKPYETPSALLIQGVYRWTRNPMYLGMVLSLGGLSIALGTASPFITAVLMFLLLDRKFIPHEEQILLEQFGAQFLDYKQRVRRWI